LLLVDNALAKRFNVRVEEGDVGYENGMAQPAIVVLNRDGEFVYWWAAVADSTDGGGANNVTRKKFYILPLSSSSSSSSFFFLFFLTLFFSPYSLLFLVAS
jgi:hypothetical protein